MSDLRQAAQMALETCTDVVNGWESLAPLSVRRAAIESLDALRAALAEPGSDYERGFIDGMSEQAKRSVDKAVNRMAEPEQEQEQEPVAWISEGGDVSRSKRYMDEMGFKCEPLYTAPTPRKWVGLTREEIWETPTLSEFAEYIEAKLKEKNT